MWQTRSENGLAVYLTYGIYDSIRPALFGRVGSRGARLDLHGLLTPPTSPLSSPGNSFLLSPPASFPPTTNKSVPLAVFLTSKIGLRSSGVLHGGVAEVDVGQQTASLKVTAKIAFVKSHQNNMFHELSVYNHLASKDVKAIPPVLGIFHNASDNGPYCLVLHDAGLSIHDRNACISVLQRYIPCLLLQRVYLDFICSSHHFDEMLKSIHNAGIVHGNIRLDNLLVNDSGDVAIVDFDCARWCLDTKEHDKERQSLLNILKTVLQIPSHLDDRLPLTP
jgi:serine/threonine protein kinase